MPHFRLSSFRLLFALALCLFLPWSVMAQDAQGEDAAAEAPQFPSVMTTPGTDPERMELRVLPLTADDLAALADIWLGNAKDGTAEVTNLRLQLLDAAEGAQADALRTQLGDAMERRRNAFAVLSVVVDGLETKGGDEAAIASYRSYRSAVLAVEAQKTDWRTLLNLAMRWVMDRDGGIALAIKVGVIAAAFFGLMFAARIVRGMSMRGFRRVPNISKLLIAFLSGVVYWITVAVGLMIVLSALGVNVTPLFALFGGAAFIVAFAMQDTLGNLAAGVMIIINRPFDEGDYVNVAGVGGTVKSVSIVSTTVTTPDNQIIVIPNSKVWGDIITNVTASSTRRVDLVFGIGYDDNIAAAQGVLEKVVAGHPMVMADPAPVIRVNELADSSVNFVCRPWVRSADYWTVYWDLTRQVKEAFDAEGISIPYPQTDMHLRVASPLQLEGSGGVSGSGTQQGTGRPAGAPDFAAGDEVG